MKRAQIIVDIDLEEGYVESWEPEEMAASLMEALVCDSSLPDWVGVISDVNVKVVE